MSNSNTDYTRLEMLLEEAEQHGADCGELEAHIGDLEGMLRDCWKIMTPVQRDQLCSMRDTESAEPIVTTTFPDEELSLDEAKRRAAESCQRYEGILYSALVDEAASGFVYASSRFNDGEPIKTPPVTKIGTDNGLICCETGNGARYLIASFIDEEAANAVLSKLS